jgi:hypothetical protein
LQGEEIEEEERKGLAPEDKLEAEIYLTTP